MRIHAQICNEDQCLLFDHEMNMIGMLESSQLLYLISKLNAVIDNPEVINNENIVISCGRINKTKTIKIMHEKGYTALQIANETGIKITTIHELLIRVKKGYKENV